MARMLSISELCELTGKGDKTIVKKLRELVPVPGPSNSKLYDSKKALNLIFTGTEDLNTERAKLTTLQAEKAEIEIGRLKGELIPVEEVVSAVEKEYSFVRSQIRSIPTKLAKPLSLITDPNEVFLRLQEIIDEVLSELVSDKNYEHKRIESEAARSEISSESKASIEATTEVKPS